MDALTRYARCKKHEKTKQGFLMRAYRNMKSRVTGVQHKKAYLYAGLSLLPKEDFYAWARASEDFHRLFDAWVLSGYERRLSPSVDRVDPGFGYELHNMQWITHGENSRKATIQRHYGLAAA